MQIGYLFFFFSSVDIEDEDAWDFGTVKAPPMPAPKTPLPMHNSPSQYSVNTLAAENRPQPSQLPRTTSSNFVSSSPYSSSSSSSSSSRVSEIMTKMQSTQLRHTSGEFDDNNQNTARATELNAIYARNNDSSSKRSSLAQPCTNPLPPLPNKSPSSRSVSTVSSLKYQNESTLLESILPLLDQVSHSNLICKPES
ncbi:hypothetical protein BD560DRAFT_158569 [Blakeslea trispora]|nr:hypothetical protein BD560DRAFT_158569 [Blakeslea trispora]